MVTTCDVCGGKYRRSISTSLDTTFDFCKEHLENIEHIIKTFIQFSEDLTLWEKIFE